jgi:hypothetical protein
MGLQDLFFGFRGKGGLLIYGKATFPFLSLEANSWTMQRVLA